MITVVICSSFIAVIGILIPAWIIDRLLKSQSDERQANFAERSYLIVLNKTGNSDLALQTYNEIAGESKQPEVVEETEMVDAFCGEVPVVSKKVVR